MKAGLREDAFAQAVSTRRFALTQGLNEVECRRYDGFRGDRDRLIGRRNMKKTFMVALENNKEMLDQFVERMKKEEVERRIKDYWTIYEHIDHLVETQKMLLGRIEQFLEEESPVMRPYTPADKPKLNSPKKTARELVAEFRDLRDRQIKRIRTARKEVWKKTGKHEEYDRYSFEILLRHMIFHDYYHMYRMEELWIEKEQYINELK